jgi:predicted small secreted protein
MGKELRRNAKRHRALIGERAANLFSPSRLEIKPGTGTNCLGRMTCKQNLPVGAGQWRNVLEKSSGGLFAACPGSRRVAFDCGATLCAVMFRCFQQEECQMLRKVVFAFALAGATLAVSACNTVKGAGQDIESVGQAGDDAINKN